MDLKEQAILGSGIGGHWYYRSKLAALLRWTGEFSPREVLDVGAGSGFFSRELLARTAAAAATCVDPGYEAERDETCAGKPLRFRREAGGTNADVLLLMDVLEHVEDDRGLLRHYAGQAGRGAHVVITVPAFQWLWSGHDVFLEHRRRYTLRGVEALALDSGLIVQRGAYFFASVFPLAVLARFPAVLRRLVRGGDLRAQSAMKRHGALGNALLGSLCAAELPVFPSNRLAGLTAFVHARVA